MRQGNRITLTRPDGTVTGEYLQVVVVANANTGLAEADVFYFGNAIGESGNFIADAIVNITDMLGGAATTLTILAIQR